eukprot:5616616-Amphidinium_carterae.1
MIGRLTANLKRQPGQEVKDYFQSSAYKLRQVLPADSLRWHRRLIQLQGQLVGHVLRQTDEHPEHCTMRWRSREWCGFNGLLPAYSRVMQYNQGNIDSLGTWWARRLPLQEPMHQLAEDR